MTRVNQRYISNELSHFVGKGLPESKQFSLLLKILSEGVLKSGEASEDDAIPFALFVKGNRNISENEMFLPWMVCFCDIPIDDLSIHTKKYSRFGLSFSKDFIVSKGGKPVSYIPKQGKSLLSQGKSYSDYYDEMAKKYFKFNQTYNDGELLRFFDYHFFCYLMFFDHMKDVNDNDNYYLEREWRVIGKVNFEHKDIQHIFLPKQMTYEFKEKFPEIPVKSLA